MNAQEKLDEKIALCERKLAQLKQLRATLDDGDVWGELTDIFEENGEKTRGSKKRRARGSPSFELMRNYFVRRNNHWLTIKEIEAGTRVKKGSIRQILYRVYPKEFDRQSLPDGGRESKFRLKHPPD